MSLELRAKIRKVLEGRDYVPHPMQQELHDDTHRYKVIRCGRRFGKTVFAVNKLIEEAALNKGEYWFVAPTYKQAKMIAWKMLREFLPKDLISGKPNETELSVDLISGSTITLKGSDDSDKLRGVGLNGIVFDEFAFAQPVSWEIIRPVLTQSKGWAIFISTPNGYNHFHDMYLNENEDEDYKSFHYTSYDNPHVDPSEIDKVKRTMPEEAFKQEYMADFMKRSGAIWKDFGPIHIAKRRHPKEMSTIYGSIDFGFAIGHDTAFLLHEVTSEGVYTFDGFNVSQTSIDKIDEMMKTMTQGLMIHGLFPDPARPDLIEELRKKEWPMMETLKDVELGIAKVAEYMQYDPVLKKPKWQISGHLKKAIEQIEQYVWKEVRGDDGRFKNVPDKKDDDYCDTLRYFLFNYLNDTREELTVTGEMTGLGGVKIPTYNL